MNYAQSMVPGMPAPGDPSGQSVSALNSRTKPLPNTVAAESKYYYLTVPNSSMHRPDGMRIAFVHGIHETNLESTQKYLDGEIAFGNLYLRPATAEEIREYNMTINPRGTIRQELQQEVEASTREKLTAEIMEMLRQKGVDVSHISESELVSTPQAPAPTTNDERKLQESDAANKLLASLSGGTRSGSGTLLQSSITGSDKLAGNAAGSSSSSEL
jgi:hypothetical protein